MIRHPVIGLTEARGESKGVLTFVFQTRDGAGLLDLCVSHRRAHDVATVVGPMTL